MEDKISNFQFTGEDIRNRKYVFKLSMEGQLKIGLKMVEKNLIHVLASDAYHAEYRPFKLVEALGVIEEKLGKNYADTLTNNAEKIFKDEKINNVKYQNVN